MVKSKRVILPFWIIKLVEWNPPGQINPSNLIWCWVLSLFCQNFQPARGSLTTSLVSWQHRDTFWVFWHFYEFYMNIQSVSETLLHYIWVFVKLFGIINTFQNYFHFPPISLILIISARSCVFFNLCSFCEVCCKFWHYVLLAHHNQHYIKIRFTSVGEEKLKMNELR